MLLVAWRFCGTNLVLAAAIIAAYTGDELHKAPDVKQEDATRRKSENARRTALDIAPANYRPRPELGTDAVAEKVVRKALDKAKTDKACRKVIGSSK